MPEGEMRPEGEFRSRRASGTLYRYVLRELIFPVLFALAGFTLVVLTKDLLAYTDLVINRGLGVSAVAWIAFFDSLPVVAQILPFSVLVGTLVTLGRLGADRELLVLEASGLSPVNLVGPIVTFAVIATGVGLALSMFAAPWATRSLDAVLNEQAREKPAAVIRAGVVNALGDLRLEAREVSSAGDQMSGVLLWVPAVGETVFAERGRIVSDGDGEGGNGSLLVLEDGVVVLSAREKARQLRFDHMESELPDAVTEPIHSDFIATASMRELRAAALEHPSAGFRSQALIAWHQRMALPVGTLMFGFLAVPLFLSRSHFSRAGGAALGILATVAYYALVELGDGLIRSGRFPIWAATWLPDAVFAVVGVALLARATRLSAMGRVSDRPHPRERPHLFRSSERIRVRRNALPRYVMGRFLQMAALCFVVLLVAYLLVDALDNLKWFAKYQATVGEVLRFYAARIPVLAARVIPMALLVAASLTVSLLSVQGEMMGMRACGIPTARAVLPVLLLCAIGALLYYGLNNELVPRASALASHLKQTEIKNRGSQSDSPRSAVWFRVGEKVYEAKRLDLFLGQARDITVYDLGEDGLPKNRTDARLARHLGSGRWRLVDPVRVEIEPAALRRVPAPSVALLGEEVPAEVETAHLSVSELRREIEEVESSGYDATNYRVDLYAKLAAPLACLVLPALALFFAAAGPPFPTPVHTLVLSAVVAVGHVLLSGVGNSLGYGGAIPPALAGLGPMAIFGALATWLALRIRGFGQGF